MRAALFAALSCATIIPGQVVMDPERIKQAVTMLEAPASKDALSCEVRPIRPALNFTFRFQAGYVFTVPMKQHTGSGHVWAVLTRVTSLEGTLRSVYLMDVIRLPNIPETKLHAEAAGSYLLGEGRYSVAWLLMDDQGRSCRKSWNIEVALGRGDKSVQLAMLPGAVSGLSQRGLPARGLTRGGPQPVESEAVAAAPSLKLTVLVDAAPFTPRRTSRAGLSGGDRNLLLGMLSALLERLPTAAVKLVLFNLEQQRELLRQDGFQLRDLNRVSQALNGLSLGTVDARTLANQGGHLALLADMINGELRAERPADAVVFLGPRERYDEKIPPEMLDKPGEGAPHFFYLQYRPPRRAMVMPPVEQGGDRRGPLPGIVMPSSVDFPDSVSRAMDRLKGDTIRVHNPIEFAKAIERIERRASKGRVSPADGPRRAN